MRSSIWIISGTAALLACMLVAAASNPRDSPGKWEIQYLYSENKSDLTITALKFPSALRGVASGVIAKRVNVPLLGEAERAQPVMLVTSDGGKKWTEVPGIKQVANSLFFVDDSNGWMVARDGIWKTQESGRSWKRISDVKGMEEVFFVSPAHGFAVGSHERVLETEDGGVTWKPVPFDPAKDSEERKREAKRDPTTFNLVAFGDAKTGIISGTTAPPEATTEGDRSWANPAGYRYYSPSKSTVLYTQDGGKTWKQVVNRIYGELTQISLQSERVGLALFEFRDIDPWPSDVYRIDISEIHSQRTFREHNRAVTDVLLVPGGDAWVASVEPVGKVRSPIPGKVKMLRSHNLTNWEEVPVDYRAVAHTTMLAGATGDNVWAATDTGMILHYKAP